MATIEEELKLLYPYLPGEILDLFVDQYIELGDPALALAAVRQDPVYDTYYPGNKRDDGTVRLSEAEYHADVEAFKTELQQYGLNWKDFRQRIPELIEGNVRPDMFRQRLASAWVNIGANTEAVRAEYARLFGTGDISVKALFASVIDPTTDPLVFEQRFRTAQVAGEAKAAGFSLRLGDAERLASFGLNQQAAREFYTSARQLVPTLGELVARHNDPDDDFSLDELTDAVVIGDPEQRERLERLFSQERSQFSPFRLFDITQGGGLAGLRQS